MNAYVERTIEAVKKKHAGQPEFCQEWAGYLSGQSSVLIPAFLAKFQAI